MCGIKKKKNRGRKQEPGPFVTEHALTGGCDDRAVLTRKCRCKSSAVEGSVCARIDMNRIGRHIKTRKGVVIEIAVGFVYSPFELTDSVTTLSFIDGSEVERTMDKCARMSEVDISTKGKEVVLSSVGFR